MSIDDSVFWLDVLFTTLATAFGVFLAFALDRAVERRRQDAAAFWVARHSFEQLRCAGLRQEQPARPPRRPIAL